MHVEVRLVEISRIRKLFHMHVKWRRVRLIIQFNILGNLYFYGKVFFGSSLLAFYSSPLIRLYFWLEIKAPIKNALAPPRRLGINCMPPHFFKNPDANYKLGEKLKNASAFPKTQLYMYYAPFCLITCCPFEGKVILSLSWKFLSLIFAIDIC